MIQRCADGRGPPGALDDDPETCVALTVSLRDELIAIDLVADNVTTLGAQVALDEEHRRSVVGTKHRDRIRP
jgi:hypothetical protein